jgi:hypothetical protein
VDVAGCEFDARMVDDELCCEERNLGKRAAQIEETVGI